MGRRRKPPTLREKNGCLVTDIYKPDGKRTTVSFGSTDDRSRGKIHAAFGQWLELYEKLPHRVLSYDSPYKAIDDILNPAAIVRVGEFYDKYLAWLAEATPHLRNEREAPDVVRTRRLGRFLDPFRSWPVKEFGPEQLLAVRQSLIDYRYGSGNQQGEETRGNRYHRPEINRVINQLHRMWGWGVGREITTEAQCRRLKEVKPLRAGRSDSPEPIKRPRVTQEEFDRVLEHTNPVVGDMLRLLWLTGMRPGEVCRMRPVDILHDDEACWLYIPGRDKGPVGDHKTAHRQRVRAIPLAGDARRIVAARVEDFDSLDPVFSPAEAVEAYMKKKFPTDKVADRTGQAPTHPMIKPGKMYAGSSLNNAVKRACKQAGVDKFTPYDLRRSAATRIRATLSKDAARLLLGHVSAATTEIYLLDEVREAMEVAKKLAVRR
jgi:integrase